MYIPMMNNNSPPETADDKNLISISIYSWKEMEPVPMNCRV